MNCRGRSGCLSGASPRSNGTRRSSVQHDWLQNVASMLPGEFARCHHDAWRCIPGCAASIWWPGTGLRYRSQIDREDLLSEHRNKQVVFVSVPSPRTPWIAHPRLLMPDRQALLPPRIPQHAAETVCRFVDSPHDRFVVATLFVLPMIQAAAYRTLHDRFQNEFDRAASIGSIQLLDRLLAYCKLMNLEPRFSLSIYGAVDSAGAKGHVQVLQWWKGSGLPPPLPNGCPLSEASKHGHVAVLQWYKDSGWPLDYSWLAMDQASEAGHVPVLQWWKDSGLPLKFDRAMRHASSNNHINVLQWWKDSGLRIRTEIHDLDNVSSIEVLEWWRRSGLEIFCGDSLIRASESGNLEVLDWWKSSGLKLTHINAAVYSACRAGNLGSLQWWKDSGLDVDVRHALTNCFRIPPAVVQWWGKSGWPAISDESHLVEASSEGRVDILQIWKASGENVEYGEKPLDSALLSGNVAALSWWKESGLELKFSSPVTEKLGDGSIGQGWLKENGLI
ncbi:hypothetical protein DFJ73DRAFT_422846 [Zopfochytrium polystomum]|nr:hypothetical protein DFJ73DRAFT_422846 [Zopfochytrium polystomum]